jgi:hypothetical protein
MGVPPPLTRDEIALGDDSQSSSEAGESLSCDSDKTSHNGSLRTHATIHSFFSPSIHLSSECGSNSSSESEPDPLVGEVSARRITPQKSVELKRAQSLSRFVPRLVAAHHDQGGMKLEELYIVAGPSSRSPSISSDTTNSLDSSSPKRPRRKLGPIRSNPELLFRSRPSLHLVQLSRSNTTAVRPKPRQVGKGDHVDGSSEDDEFFFPRVESEESSENDFHWNGNPVVGDHHLLRAKVSISGTFAGTIAAPNRISEEEGDESEGKGEGDVCLEIDFTKGDELFDETEPGGLEGDQEPSPGPVPDSELEPEREQGEEGRRQREGQMLVEVREQEESSVLP